MPPPSRIGRYEVLRLLGQGGMGRVFLAKDSVLGRYVAVKILRDDLGLPPESRDALFARMRQEARAAAAIEHPHIVTLHDMGDDPDVGLYLVFEYLTGPTLRDKIREGPLDAVVVGRIARALGDALTTAHDAGVVHRDVKPENVILSPHGAKLTDFGIARLGDSTLTLVGSIIGTPAYSAPEALALAEYGPLTDQFSLAATVFEAICARRAFPGEDALAIAARIATEPAPLLPFAPFAPSASADPHLVSRLDAVLARALAKDPARRYPTCRAFGEALALAVQPLGYETVPPLSERSPRSLIPRATRRVHNFVAAIALLVIASLVVFGKPSGSGISLKRVADEFGTAATAARASEVQAGQRHRAHSSGASPGSPPVTPTATSSTGPLPPTRLARAADADILDAGPDAEP